MPDDDRYSLTELADLAGVTPRTVRYYLAQGLLPAVGQTGPGSKYGAGHLARLRLIRRLQAEHLPLAEIRRRLEALDADAIREPGRVAGTRPPPTDSALDYLRTVLGDGARPSARVPPRMRRPRRRRAAGRCRLVLARRQRHARAGRAGHAAAAPPAADAGRGRRPATPLERSQWERIVLAPDVELHIRRPLHADPAESRSIVS